MLKNGSPAVSAAGGRQNRHGGLFFIWRPLAVETGIPASIRWLLADFAAVFDWRQVAFLGVLYG
jgi:hypothetical protein